MTRVRIFRGIVAIASLSALAPQAVLSETPSSSSSSTPKISSRFLDSVEQANPSSSSLPSSSPPLAGEIHPPIGNEVENELMVEDGGRSRRQLSWWSVALQLVHLPCPPEGHHQPPHCKGHGGGSGGGGSGGSSGSGGGGSGSGGGGGGGGGGGSGGDGSGSGEADGGSGAGSTAHNSALSPGALPFWMLIAAAATAAVAIGAMVVGSRRKAKERRHPLRGVLDRRMRLFGGMSDSCFERRDLCGAQNGSFGEGERTPAGQGSSEMV